MMCLRFCVRVVVDDRIGDPPHEKEERRNAHCIVPSMSYIFQMFKRFDEIITL